MKKGFTLVELLAVVVILGIVLVIALPAVTDIVNNARLNAHIKNEEMLVETTKLYLTNNKSKIPLQVGETSEVSLTNLQNENLAGEIIDPRNKNNTCNGYVLITKIDNNIYDYTPHLNCIDPERGSAEADRLILHYKFDDFQEYTENLINNNPVPVVNTSGYLRSGGDGTMAFSESEFAIRWIRNSYETWGAYFSNNSLNTYEFDINSQYTASFEWKYGIGHSAGTSQSFQIVQGNGQNSIFGSSNLLSNSVLQSNGWYKFTKTNTPANRGFIDTGSTVGFRIITGNQGANITDIYWRNLQFEKKSNATPFIDGIREGIVRDYSGNNNHVVLDENTPRWVEESVVGTGAYEFDSEQERFIMKELTNFPSYPFSLAAWVNRKTNAVMVPLSFTETTSAYLCFHFSSQFRIEIRSNNWSNFSSGVNTSIDEWVYLTAVVSGDQSRKIYINGKFATEDTTSAILPNFNSFYIGKQRNMPMGVGHGPLQWDGLIDDVRIYDRALSGAEIKNMYELDLHRNK